MSDIPKARAILQSLIGSPVKLKRKVINEKIKEAIACMKRAPAMRDTVKRVPLLTDEEKSEVYKYTKAHAGESFDEVAEHFGTSRTRVAQAWSLGEMGKL